MLANIDTERDQQNITYHFSNTQLVPVYVVVVGAIFCDIVSKNSSANVKLPL